MRIQTGSSLIHFDTRTPRKQVTNTARGKLNVSSRHADPRVPLKVYVIIWSAVPDYYVYFNPIAVIPHR